MGLGPHGGMHNPQVLHSDQEPFPAKRGEVPESDLEVLVGGGCEREASGTWGLRQRVRKPLSLHGLPHPHSMVPGGTHRGSAGCCSSAGYPAVSQHIVVRQICGPCRSWSVSAGLGSPGS